MTPEQLEMKLMPVVYRMEQRGLNLDGVALKHDYNHFFFKLDELDDQIHQMLGQVFDIDSNEDLANAIQRVYPDAAFLSTPKGARSVSKDSLVEAMKGLDGQLLGALLVRGALATSVRTFIGPWHLQYEKHGRLFIKWNQFRNYTDTGARTGRLSSSPNLQNIPVEWEGLKLQLERAGYKLEDDVLPRIRRYIIPDPGKVFVGGDYAAQEMRLLAHFAGGALLDSIIAEPRKDIHQIAAEIAGISRRVAKTLGFAVLYGAGVGRIAESLYINVSEATRIKNLYLSRLPEIKKLSKEIMDLGKAGGVIKTLGGRGYKTDPTVKVINGRPVTYEYKLINYKMQGSAADQTKQAMVNYDDMDRGELVLSVHDQLVAQEDISSAMTDPIVQAMASSYQDVLRYLVIVDPAKAHNFAAMK